MDSSRAITHRTVARRYYVARDKVRATLNRLRAHSDLERETRMLCDVLRLHDGVVVHHQHGQPWRNWPSLSPPRVSFEAPDDVIRSLQAYLDRSIETGTLHYLWTLRGDWLDNATRWHLAIEDRRLSGLVPWAWSHEKARSDLASLSGWAYAGLHITETGRNV